MQSDPQQFTNLAEEAELAKTLQALQMRLDQKLADIKR